MNKLLLILIILSTGCSTIPDKDISVQQFRLHIVNNMSDCGYNGYDGYCKGRDIWVKWQGSKPDFYTLGHEVWHLQECGGQWHGNFFVK